LESITWTACNCNVADYLNLDWKLIPCCSPAPNGRGCNHHGESCPSPGKRPLVRGWRKRPPRSSQIKDWAKRWPEANWAVLTGEPSGIVVLDLDAQDAELPGKLALTPLSLTGRGRHYFLRFTGGIPRSQTVGRALEVKSTGSYVILPKSLHPSGATYTWAITPWELAGECADVPDWLPPLLRKPQKPSQPKLPTAAVVRGVQQGRRNTAAAQMAGVLLRRFEPELWESHCWPLLVAWNSRCRPPLSLEELRSVFEKIAQRETAQRLKRAEQLLANPQNRELFQRILHRLHQDPALPRSQHKRALNAHRYRQFDALLHAAYLHLQDAPRNPLPAKAGVCIKADAGKSKKASGKSGSRG